MSSLYEAPKSSSVSVPNALKDGSILKAVVAGFVVDVVGTIAVTGVLSFLYGIYLLRSGTPEADLVSELSSPGVAEPHVLFGQAIGLLISFYAGRLCCKIAGINAKKAIIIMASIMIALGVFSAINVYPTWGNILMAIVGSLVYYLSYRSFVAANT